MKGLKISKDRYTAEKTKFYTKDFFSKCDQIRSFLPLWKTLFFCAVSEFCFIKVFGEILMTLVNRDIISSVFQGLLQIISN